MKNSELKREDFKSEVDYLLALVSRHKKLFANYVALKRENVWSIRKFFNKRNSSGTKNNFSEVYRLLESQYGKPHSN